MRTDTLAMDTDFLLSVLSFSEPYRDEIHARTIRNYWRKVARKNKIRIETFDNTHAKEIIITRKDRMPHDEFLERAAREDTREKLNRYLDRGSSRDAS